MWDMKIQIRNFYVLWLIMAKFQNRTIHMHMKELHIGIMNQYTYDCVEFLIDEWERTLHVTLNIPPYKFQQ